MKDKKKVLVWSLVGIISIIFIVIGISYALWTMNFSQTTHNQITSKCFRLEFIEEENSNISLREAYPISDEDGRNLVPYTFKVVNECSAKAKYTIRLETLNHTTLDEKYIKSVLNEGVIKPIHELEMTNVTLENASKSYVLENGSILGNEEKSYQLRLWIDGSVTSENQEVMNRTFESKVTIEGDYDPTYTEELLHGSDPVLKDGLIPVTIDNNGMVRKADVTKEWYQYENKEWANAVILEDESIQYQNNEEIPESNIESYFVWIPRYRYQIFDNGLYYELSDSVERKEQEIKVLFESRSTRASKGTKQGDWLTHPAFTSFDVNGIWVGKFETGYKGASTTESAQQNIVDIEKVQVKPNVYSWRGIQVANAHLNAYNYKREYDSHMMKNTEWGAVAYLQYSKYGSMSSVRLNNNAAFITGYSAVKAPTCGNTGANEECNKFEATSLGVDGNYTINYKNPFSVISSTTGNYSGIYDMSGGAIEYVMGVMADKQGVPASGNSNIYHSNFIGALTDARNGTDKDKTSWTKEDGGIPYPDAKYYDLYSYFDYSFAESQGSLTRRILGDATGEFALWAGQLLPKSHAPYIIRGLAYNYGMDALLLNTNRHYGSAMDNDSYRLVLAV